MTDKTPAMPELPEPEGFMDQTLGGEPAFTADQMRARDAMWMERLAALQSAQPAAAVSDEEIRRLGRHGAWRYKYSSDPAHSSTYKFNDACLLRFARAILALRPQAVPMTEWQPMSTAPSSKTVLLACKNEYRRVITVKACYYPKHTEEASEEDDALDYDEATDTYYVAAGWYEDNSESEINYGITGEFLGWLPVPVFADHGITAQGAQEGV